jgi:hypothetical protein
MNTILFLSLALSTLFFSSCATTVDAFYSANAAKYEVKNVYFVAHSNPPSDMDEAIRKDLLKRKLNVVVGPDTNKVSDADAILKYNETWNKELASSITALDVMLFNKSGELIASSHWKNSKFSLLATLAYIVNDTVEIIFEKVQIKP